MRRREFTSLLCSAAVSWPLAARAQQSPLRRIGRFPRTGASPVPFAYFVADVRAWPPRNGLCRGPQHLQLNIAGPSGQHDRLPPLAADLRSSTACAVLAATGGFRRAVAAKTATGSIPIVFTGGGDPVALGLVTNLARRQREYYMASPPFA